LSGTVFLPVTLYWQLLNGGFARTVLLATNAIFNPSSTGPVTVSLASMSFCLSVYAGFLMRFSSVPMTCLRLQIAVDVSSTSTSTSSSTGTSTSTRSSTSTSSSTSEGLHHIIMLMIMPMAHHDCPATVKHTNLHMKGLHASQSRALSLCIYNKNFSSLHELSTEVHASVIISA
jgi:hypothetical protein